MRSAEERRGRVAVLVAGSIAATKACEVVTGLRKRGVEVRVAMTAAATRFVSVTTFQSCSGHPVLVDAPPVGDGGPFHRRSQAARGGDADSDVPLSTWAQLHVVVPASADVIARLALGLADDAVTATALASGAPLLVVPAMEPAMWQSRPTQEHVATLRSRGHLVVGPASGRLASGAEGPGRMVEAVAVVDAVLRHLDGADPWLAGSRVVVTAGGTREPIDPVRYIGNRSSGKMGNALAAEAMRCGAQVTLITAAPPPAPQRGLDVVEVETAAEMLDAVRAALRGASALIMAAAVADYRPAERASRKVKKQDAAMRLELVPTIDVLRALRDDDARRGVVVVGFAAETDDLLTNARRKLEAKGLDLMVANDVSAPDVGMGSDENAVTLLGRDGLLADVARAPKAEIAAAILRAVRPLVEARQRSAAG